MGYIVYTPDVERGQTAYTQRQFDTIKELARWAMDAALADAPAPAPAPAQASVPESVPELVPELKVDEVDPNVTALLEGIPEGNPYRTLIEAKDWAGVAKNFDSMIRQNFFGGAQNYSDYISCDINAVISSFLGQARKFASYIVSLFDEAPPISWDLLPAEFKTYMFPHNNGISDLFQLTATKPLSKEYATIWKFFSEGMRHTSWKDITIEFNGIKWGNAKELTEAVTDEWWSEKIPSDNIREFIVKCAVVNLLEKSKGEAGKLSVIGANELLGAILSGLDKLELPGSFIRWAGFGITHKHCKAALTALGITQTRRSDGQKYVGIALVSNKDYGNYIVEKSLEPYASSDSLDIYDSVLCASDAISPRDTRANINELISDYLGINVVDIN